MIERLSHYLVCNLICIRGTQVVAAKSECRHLNTCSSQVFFGTVPSGLCGGTLSLVENAWLDISGAAPMMAAPCINFRRLRCGCFGSTAPPYNIFSAEKDGPYSQAIRACLEPPIAWY